MRNTREAINCTREIARYLAREQTAGTPWGEIKGDLSFALMMLGAQVEHLENTSSALKREARRLKFDLTKKK